MKRLQLLIVLWLGCLAVMYASSEVCYNPASNSLIPVDGAYTTMVDVVSDTTGIEVSYVLGTITLVDDNLFPGSKQLNMTGFGQSYLPGTPWVPIKADTYYLDGDVENLQVDILSAESDDYQMEVAPSRRLLMEQEDSLLSVEGVLPVGTCEFQSIDSIATILKVGRKKNKIVVSVLVRPIQYDSGRKMIRVYKAFSYRLSYTKPSTIALDSSGDGGRKELTHYGIKRSYLVVGRDECKDVAQEFINWKTQCGFDVVGVFSSKWTSDRVKAAIDSVYDACNGLDYVLLLGDHTAIPGFQYTERHFDRSIAYVSDYDFSCVDGDFIPDLQLGRIPGKTPNDIKASLEKIVLYEKSPTTSDNFYKNWLLNAYFQIDGEEKERTSRRFVETCEDIREYVSQFGVNGIRNYYALSDANPKYWSYSYGSGGPVPEELQRPNFAWNGNTTTINKSINAGCNLVITRTHGGVNCWSPPSYYTSNLSGLKQVTTSQYPIVYSLACNTGNFSSSQISLCQALISRTLSGCVAAVGATQDSYSILNDAYAHGVVCHLFPEPGLFKPLTNGIVPTMGLTTQYGPTLGESLESANIRMDEVAPLSKSQKAYQKRLYHIFGDPSMWINTAAPTSVYISAGLHYQDDADSRVPVFRISVGDEKCMVAIVDSKQHSYLYYDTDVEIKNPCLPFEITVTGHNKRPSEMTYANPDTSAPLSDFRPFIIDRVVIDERDCTGRIYTVENGLLRPDAYKYNYGIMLYSSRGIPLYSTPIDVNKDYHLIPIGNWHNEGSVATYIVALTCSGSIIDSKTFVVNY